MQAVYWEEREKGEMGERRSYEYDKRKTVKKNSTWFPFNKTYRCECNQSMWKLPIIGMKGVALPSHLPVPKYIQFLEWSIAPGLWDQCTMLETGPP